MVNPGAPDAVPREGYGPGTTAHDRFSRKVEELTNAGIKTSLRTLMREDALYRYHGILGLVDKNRYKPELVMPNGDVVRPYVTVALDVYTRSVVGFHVHPAAPSAFDHQMLLIRSVMPRSGTGSTDPSTWLINSRALPGAAMVAMGQAAPDAPARPFIAIETLTMDRGKDFLAARALAEHLGTTVIDAPPRSPVKKPHVEKFFDFMNKNFCAGFDSYLGHSPDHRGYVPGAPVPFRVFVDHLDRWITVIHQNRPHRGLCPKELPGRSFSPNQIYAAAFDASAGIPSRSRSRTTSASYRTRSG